MTSDGLTYGSSAAFLRALNERLRIAARTTERPVEELRRQFLTQRFLARVFSRQDSGWVLLGGGGLLVRLPGAARHSQDLDLMHRTNTMAAAIAELEELMASEQPDPLTFRMGRAKTMSGHTPGVIVSVDALAGAVQAGSFPIDLSTERTTVGQTERIRPRPVIEMGDVAELPEFVLYPLPDQVADKVCTMYDSYGPQRSPSTRYHDLVDLMLIIRSCSLDAAQTVKAVRAQEARRGVKVPASLLSPGPQWGAGYRAIAENSSLPPTLHTLERALAAAGLFLTPLLTGNTSSGQWNPAAQVWE